MSLVSLVSRMPWRTSWTPENGHTSLNALPPGMDLGQSGGFTHNVDAMADMRNSDMYWFHLLDVLSFMATLSV